MHELVKHRVDEHSDYTTAILSALLCSATLQLRTEYQRICPSSIRDELSHDLLSTPAALDRLAELDQREDEQNRLKYQRDNPGNGSSAHLRG